MYRYINISTNKQVVKIVQFRVLAKALSKLFTRKWFSMQRLECQPASRCKGKAP